MSTIYLSNYISDLVYLFIPKELWTRQGIKNNIKLSIKMVDQVDTEANI